MYFSSLLPLAVALTFVIGEYVQNGDFDERAIDCESNSLPPYPIYSPITPSDGSTSVLPTSAQDPGYSVSSEPELPTSTLKFSSIPAYTPIISSTGGGAGTNTLPNGSSTSGAPFTNSSLSAAPTTAASSGTGSSLPLVTYTFVGSSTSSISISGSGISTGSSLPATTSSGIFTNSSVPGTTSASATGNTSSSPGLSSGNSSSALTSFQNSTTSAYITGPIASSELTGTGLSGYSTRQAPFPSNSTSSPFGSGGTGTTVPLTTSTELLTTTTATATLTLTTRRLCQLDNCLLPLQPTDPVASSSASALCNGFSDGQFFPGRTIFPPECNWNRIFSACSCLDRGLVPSSTSSEAISGAPTASTSLTLGSGGVPPVSKSFSAAASAFTDTVARMTSFQTMTLSGRLPPPPPPSSSPPALSEALPYSLPMSLSETRTQTRDPKFTSSFDSFIEEFQRIEDLFLEIIGEQSELAAEVLENLGAFGAQLAGQGRNNGSQ